MKKFLRYLRYFLILIILGSCGILAYRNDKFINNIVSKFNKFWNIPIYAKENIYMGSLLIALVLIILAFMSSKSISRWITNQISKKIEMNTGTREATFNILNYILMLVFSLMALSFANIPLTALTLFGGAIAIGVGFGTQNLINNFISGILIQIEQPIKVGDVIEIDKTLGKVSFIGARSTKISFADNTDMVIPNSHFLEKPFINWNLQDKVVRLCIEVGFHYDSDLHIVEKTIQDTLNTLSGLIKKTPEPKVIFSNYGSSSLDYKIDFWAQVDNNLEKEVLAGNFRKALLTRTRKNGLVIPYPIRAINMSQEKDLELVQDSELNLKT